MIQLYDVAKSYRAGAPALRGVSLEVARGDFVFVTGASGAGKSTLLRLIFSAAPPTSGQLIIHGRNTACLRGAAVAALRRQMGVVFQDFRLLPRRTVAANVGLTLEVAGCPPAEVRRRTVQVLTEVGLVDKLHALPPQLSGGEQQRVALARALVHEPCLLLADEPTGSLDAGHAGQIVSLLQAAHARGTTILVATHDQEWLARTPGARVVRLEAGRQVPA